MTDRYYKIVLFGITVLSLILGSSGLVSSKSSDEEAESRELIRDKGVTKIFSDYEITEDMVLNGNLKIIGGGLVVKGTVNGEIQVLGGDIKINKSAVINGTIIAIGGQIDKDPEATIKGEVLELNKDKFSISRDWEGDKGIHLNDWIKSDGPCTACSIFDPKRPHSHPYKDGGWMRYNRTEGLYLQMNFHVENEFLPGNILYGGVGRSFHRNKYSGIIGFEQRLFQDSFQLYIEKYNRSTSEDTLRINGVLNSLAAFFIHQDFLDWYEADGFGAGGFITLPWKIKISVQYRDELQSQMNTVATWSLFGSQEIFRGTYLIEEGKEISLNYKISIGQPYQWNCTSSVLGYLQYSKTESQKKSDFIYTKQDLIADSYFPFTRKLGIHTQVKAGSVYGDHFGLQHRYLIGGIGSLRGYTWKQFDGTRFSSGTIEIVFDGIAVFYDRAAIWSDGADELSSNHWDKLLNSHNGESIGFSFGSHRSRIDIIKPLGTEGAQSIQINFVLYYGKRAY